MSVRWAGHIADEGEEKNAYNIFAGKRERNRSFRKLGLGSRIILKWILQNGINCVDWIHLIQYRAVCCQHGSGPYKLKLNSVACSPQANYTDRAAAAC
jgi:hypothetical protein